MAIYVVCCNLHDIQTITAKAIMCPTPKIIYEDEMAVKA